MNPMHPALAACALALAQLAAAPALGQAATDVACTRCVNNSDLANNAVTSEKIADGSVKSNDLAASAVKTANVNNGSITFGKLATGVRNALDGALADLTTTAVEESDLSVAAADCPSSRIAVSASCFCDDNNGNNNFGVLFACAVDGNGAVAACFEEYGSFNPTKNSPVAIVQAICLGARSTDGTPWVPTPAGLAPADGAGTVEAQAQWHKSQHEAFQARVGELRAKVAAQRAQMRK